MWIKPAKINIKYCYVFYAKKFALFHKIGKYSYTCCNIINRIYYKFMIIYIGNNNTKPIKIYFICG